MTTDRTQQHSYELNTEARLTRLETTNELIAKTLIEINQKIDKLDNKIDTKINILDSKIDKLEGKIDSRIDKIDNRLWQLLLMYGGGFLTLLTIMAHGFKWL